MDPPTRWNIDLDYLLAGVEDRRHHQVTADDELVIQAVDLRIVGKVHERVADDGETSLRSLLHQFDSVGLPGGVDLREAGEVQKGLLIRVDLVVDLGYVALVGAEDGRKGAEFDPAHEELFRAMVLALLMPSCSSQSTF